MWVVKQIGELRHFVVGEFKSKADAVAAAAANVDEVAEWPTFESKRCVRKADGLYNVKLTNGTSFKVCPVWTGEGEPTDDDDEGQGQSDDDDEGQCQSDDDDDEGQGQSDDDDDEGQGQ